MSWATSVRTPGASSGVACALVPGTDIGSSTKALFRLPHDGSPPSLP